MWRTARKLGAAWARRKPRSSPALPFLVLVTDPARTPDPVAAAARLPRGAAVIFRGFGRPEAGELAARLASLARRRGLVLLVGADAALAARVGAAGVHLPERNLHLARRLKAARPGWLVTGAAHSRRALVRAARSGVDAALLSPAFASRSPSAGRPLGPVRFTALARGSRIPVLALGGIDARTARRISGAAGLAAVEALSG